MKALHIFGIMVLACSALIISVYGADQARDRIVLVRAERNLHRLNEAAHEAFCLLVELKREQGESVSVESGNKYQEECLGL